MHRGREVLNSYELLHLIHTQRLHLTRDINGVRVKDVVSQKVAVAQRILELAFQG